MDQRSLQILLIDDDLTMHDIFSIVVHHYGHSVYCVSDGESALNFLEEHRPDLVIIDLYLSDTNGYELLRQIQDSSFNPRCPFIATTSYSSSETLRNVLLSGFDAFLPKPISVLALVPFLYQVLDGAYLGSQS